ncbi:hypothetical protein Pcinc_011938 [Petrolisthes cinctipes]|uniref:CCHC-type domain-containing protein n=1 Tax=Petrolisthes cinctipes TaxID=88211 RepID=A0AAE1KT12_PETCI|nr:hypothetical protein Pcinc_011938 [Petrolisthes cinctipes]
MPGDVSHHRLITRPPGLPGYQPGRWCAVCGKTTSDKSIIDCSSGDCPNTSHTTCLGDSNTFDCCEVLALCTALGITAPVVYQAATADSQDSSDLLDTDTSDVAAADDDDDLEDLLKLDPRELVENIRQLRKELKRKKNILSFFEATSQTLAEKRDAVVTVLDLIDNICAIRTSAQELDTRTIAVTAKSHRIDEEWERHVASSDETANWWKLVKPRPLQFTVASTTTNNSSGPSHPLPPWTTTAPSKDASTATVPAAVPRNFRNGRNTENNKNNKTQQQTGHSDKSLSGKTVAPRTSLRNQSKSYCENCGRNGHTENNCLRRNKCTYCLRVGHTVQECRTRIAQEREENLFRRISTEQAQHNALLVQTLNRFLPPAPPDPGPAIPQPLIGNWAPRHQAHTPHPLYPAYTHSYTLQPPNLVNTAWSHAHP